MEVVVADPSDLYDESKWAPVAGPFSNLVAAEVFIDRPPPDVPQDATVTISKKADGIYVLKRER